MTGSGGEHAVLVVDDEPEVAEMVAVQLSREFDVEQVHDGRAALEAVGEGTDVVLLDRRMPDLSGDEVLERIRDRGLDCRVVIVSAVTPDYDVIDMAFDDYLCKPVAGEPLMEAVRRQMETMGDGDVAEYLAVVAKRTLLEEVRPTYELDGHDGFQALCEREERLRAGIADDHDVEALTERFEGIDRR